MDTCNRVVRFHQQGMDFVFHRPAYPVSQYIECMVEITGKSDQSYLRNYPVLKSELTFNLSSRPLKGMVCKTGILEQCDIAVVRGTHTGLFEVYIDHPLHLFVINPKPEALRQLFGYPVGEFTDRNVPIDLCLPSLTMVWHQLLQAGTTVQRFQTATRWFLEDVIHQDYEEHRLVSWIKHKVLQNPVTKIETLKKETGYSRQYLHRVFKNEVGISLKHYQEIIRINGVLDELKNGYNGNLAALACKYDYYDQTHFNKSFRKMTGETPAKVASTLLGKLPVQNTMFDSQPRSAVASSQ